jgi:hypothetical protein
MAQSQVYSMAQDQFLLVAVNLLHKGFVEAKRTDAKALYQQIATGKTVKLTTVQMDDASRADFHLSLSHSEFLGRLNFGAFRASVTALTANIARALQEQRELKVFSAQHGGNAVIFGITAVTLERGQRNVMVLAADTREAGAATILQLMYLDPTQFAGGPATAQTAPAN